MRIPPLALVLWFVVPIGAQAQSPEGCYFATPPSTQGDTARARRLDSLYRARGEDPEKMDSAYSVLQLSPGGAVHRPLNPWPSHTRFSRWSLGLGPLDILATDGFSGWRYRLVRRGAGWHGIAVSVTDEGAPTQTRTATLIRIPCPTPVP